ncbi:streptococcal hemagglutinin-like [Palaemon carinicauda]|uniref:streptococcal hemagglutinin-like n=1 Tax=Palaemon carinicauda TaxID=392227 RepID=UPI0035B5BD00
MASWTSLAVLSALAVIAAGFPDGAYNIPRVGTGRRSQYYVLHSDGTYKYGHDTGEGAFESAKLNAAGELDGEFGYRDEDGQNVNLQYKSGQSGFVARGSHLPVPHPDFVAAHAEASARPPFVDPLADTGTDASYNFQFAGEGQTRTEQSDADGNVRGSYTYTDEEGITRTFNYVAGRDTGFVVEGNDLPQGPVESGLTPAATRFAGNRATSASQFSGSRRVGSSSGSSISASSSSTANQRFSGSRTSGSTFSSSNRQASGSRPSTSTTYSATGTSRPSSTLSQRPLSSTSGSFTQTSRNTATQRGSTGGDGSYSFSFNAGDHSRSESADANLNVEGQFSFVADDGVQRSVSYESGANRGFQASGDHLPKAPESHFGNRVSSSRRTQSAIRPSSTSSSLSPTRTPSTYRAPTVSHTHSTVGSSTGSSFGSTGSSFGSTGSSFGSTGSSFGSRRTSVGQVSSTRGSTGGASLTAQQHSSASRPQQTFSGSSSLSSSSRSVPFEEANTRSELRPDGSYAFAYETSSHSRSESGDSDNDVDGKFDFVADDDGQRREIKYEAGRDTGFIAEGAHIPVGPEVPGAPSGQPTGRIVPVQEVPFVDPLADTGLDASYNFAFDSDQYSRSETADSDGNVRGTYTVVDDDGTRRTFNFRAGKGVGFETEEVSVSRGPPPPKPATSSISSSSSSAFRGANTQATQSFRGSTSSASSTSSSASTLRGGSGVRTTSYTAPASSSSSFTSSTSSRRPVFSSGSSTLSTGASSSTSTFRGGSGLRTTSHTLPSSSTSFRQSTSVSSSAVPSRSSFTPTSVKEVFPGFKLHQYDASKNPDKFGYVLTFDDK